MAERRTRESVFREELLALYNRKYIEKDQYEAITGAYSQYRGDVWRERQRSQYGKAVQPLQKAGQPLQKPVSYQHNGKDERETAPAAQYKQVNIAEAGRDGLAMAQAAELDDSKRRNPSTKPTTNEQTRQRNITAVLISGVVLLLLGGMIFATSNWGDFSDWGKVGLIACIAILFTGISLAANKIGIRQTGFAFLVLGSLFLPITIVSAGYYRLFGEYLSLFGEGRALLGVIGGILCLVLYYRIANRLASRTFAWISLAALMATMLFAAAYISAGWNEMFLYAAVMNAFLLLMPAQIRSQPALEVFRPYAPYFIQMKIIAESAVALALVSDSIVYPLTLIAMAAVFLLLARQTYNGYLAVFSSLLMIGLLRFIVFINIINIEIMAVSIIPVIFFALYYWEKDRGKSRYHWISGLSASAVGIFFVHMQAIEGSLWALSGAMLVFAIQFGMLAIKKKPVFIFPAVPAFMLSAVYAAVALKLDSVDVECLMAALSILLYGMLSAARKKHANRMFALAGIIFPGISYAAVFVLSLVQQQWLLSFGLLLVLAAVSIHAFLKEHGLAVSAALYVSLLSFVFALLVSYPIITDVIQSDFYQARVGGSGHLVLSSLVLAGIAFVWKRTRLHALFHPYFAASLIIYGCHLLILPIYFEELHTAFIMFLLAAGSAFSALALRVYRHPAFWITNAACLALAYMAGIPFFDGRPGAALGYALLGGMFLAGISAVLKKWQPIGAVYYFWASQGYALLSAMSSFVIMVENDSYMIVWFLIPLLIFGWGAYKADAEYKRYLFGYTALTGFFFFSILTAVNYPAAGYEAVQPFMMTALAIGLLFLTGKGPWRKIWTFYWIPFSQLLLFVFAIDRWAEAGWQDAALFVVFTAISLYSLHRVKWDWLNAVPLFFLTVYMMIFVINERSSLTLALLFYNMALLLALSWFLYKGIAEKVKQGFKLDSYRIAAFFQWLLLLFNVGYADAGFIWKLGVSAVLPLYFAILRMRSLYSAERRVYSSIALFALMYPYSILLDMIPDLGHFAFEAYALPFLAIATILLRQVIAFPPVTYYIEIGVAGFIFLLLLISSQVGGTVMDAVVMGAISVAAVLFGFIYKYKSYFLSGLAAIFFNVYMNTRFLWGLLPWWLYLIIGGLSLIMAASYFEWKKQGTITETKALWKRTAARMQKWFSGWR